MVNCKRVGSGGFFTIPVGMLLLLGLATCMGCSSGTTNGGSDNGTADGSGGGGAGTDAGNTLLNEAAGYNGSLTGKVLDTQTTRASTVVPAAAFWPFTFTVPANRDGGFGGDCANAPLAVSAATVPSTIATSSSVTRFETVLLIVLSLLRPRRVSSHRPQITIAS